MASRDSLRRLRNADVAQRSFRRGDGVALHRPIHVYLQIASACNIECYMCTEHERPAHLRRGRGLVSMPLEVFERLEQEVFPWSTRLSLGVGGEPTIASRFVEYVERGARAGQEMHLTTNGTRLEREPIADVVARHVRDVQISIDGATRETYERIRLGSRWDGLQRGLELLRAKRRELGTRERCRVSFCFVLMRSNVHELKAFVEMAHALEADRVWAQHVIPATADAALEPLLHEPERYDRALAEAERRARELGIELAAPAPYHAEPSRAPSARVDREVDHAVPCALPTQALFVLYDGRVFPCCHPFAHQKMQVGDLSRQTFSEVWNDRTYRNLRAGLRCGDVHPICASCSMAHDPPLAREDPAVLLAGPDLAGFYAERDLAPAPADPLAILDASGWSDWAADVHAHAESLDEERPHLLGHIENLQQPLQTLAEHVRNLEQPLESLTAHAANLEHERAVLRVLLARKRGLKNRLRTALGWLGEDLVLPPPPLPPAPGA